MLALNVGGEDLAIQLEKFIKKQKSRKLIERLCNLEYKPTGKLAQSVRVLHLRN